MTLISSKSTSSKKTDESDCIVFVIDQITPLLRIVIAFGNNAFDPFANVVRSNPIIDFQSGNLKLIRCESINRLKQLLRREKKS